MTTSKTKSTNTPALRFKEYKSEWLAKPLENLCDKIGDGIHSTPNYDDLGEYYFINGNNFVENRIAITNTTKRVSKFEAEKHNTDSLTSNTILMSINGTIGNLALFYNEDVMLGKSACFINTKHSENKLFIFYSLKSKSIVNYFLSELTGTTIKNLSLKSIRNAIVFLPTSDEQQKIASFLSLIDEKIATQIKIIEELKSLKNGLMQKIFAQELRFKDDNGREFPDWEIRKLGDLTAISAGATPNTLKSEYWDGEIRWMNSGELNLKRVYEVENRITELGLNKSSTKIIPKYSVLIGLAGQGKTRGTIAMNMVELCTNQSIAAIMPNKDIFIPDFIYHNLDSRYDELRSLSTGDGGRGGLNLQIIKGVKISIPSLPEQIKIAAFLFRLDGKIDFEKNILQQYEIQKKYLLSNLFI